MSHRAFFAALVTVVFAVAGCASCPPVGAHREDLSETRSPRLKLELRGNRVAQMNERPATLVLTWDEPLAGELLVKDTTSAVRLRRPVDAPSGTPVSVPLTDASGKPLDEGIYEVELVAGTERAHAGFEICHCTVYY